MNLAIKALEIEINKLKDAVLDGRYDPRSLVGDTVLRMEGMVKIIKQDTTISDLFGALHAINSIKYYCCTVDEYAEIVKSIAKKALANVETQTS